MTSRHAALGLLGALAGLGAFACAPDGRERPPLGDGSLVEDGGGTVESAAPATDGGATAEADAALDACPPPAPAPSGATEAGDPCLDPRECRRDTDEVAVCASNDATDYHLKLLRCHRLGRAKLGEACAVTITWAGQTDSTVGIAGTFPPAAGYCDLREGLECSGLVCRALPAIGESCEGLPYCARGSFCDHSTCAGPLAQGALCEGVEDFLERPQCGPSARCDFVTCTCAPRFELGASCSIDGECASGACRHGACAPPGTCGGAI